MIEPMKKVVVLMSAAALDSSLEDLRRLGIVHLHQLPSPPAPLPPAGDGSKLPSPPAPLPPVGDGSKLPSPPAPLPPAGEGSARLAVLRDALALAPGSAVGELPATAEQVAAGVAVASELLELHHELPRRQSELAMLRRQRDNQAVLGRFDPQDILKLRAAGVFVRLYACSRREGKTYAGRAGVERIAASGSTVFLAQVSRDESNPLPLHQVALPECSLDELEARIAAREQALAATQARLKQLAAQTPLLRASQLHVLNALRLAQAWAGASGDAHLAWLQGFCPSARIVELSRQAAEQGWGLVVADPGNDEPVPTVLRNSRCAALFQPVMDFLGLLPGYREFNPNGIFLIFFTLFFAMILGDAGYGLLLLAATWAASRHFPALPWRMVPLGYLLAAATIGWGAMNGLWFGVPQLAELPGLRSLVVPALNAFAADSEAVVIQLCLTLGAIHLTLAHLWAAQRHWSLQSLADLGWMLVVWAAYVAALYVLVGAGDIEVTIGLALGGLMGVVLFGEQTGGSLMRGVGRGLLNLPLNLLTSLSNFSDLVSYLRLFAIGLASKEVAVAFNRLALEVGFDSVLAALSAVLFVLLGHTVNLLLGALGVIVHGLRLNLLEFSRHLDITWSGIPYDPFRLLTARDLDYERH